MFVTRLRALGRLAGEGAVEVAGEVALDAAADFSVGFAFGSAALHVGDGGGVAAHPADGDDLQGAVELAVAEAVEPVPVGAAGRYRDRGGARQHGEGGLAVDPPGVGERQQDLRGGERADASLGGGQAGREVVDQDGDLLFQLGGGAGQHDDALAQSCQGLVQHPGLPVSPARAGQVGAFAGPPVARDAAEPFAQRRRGGDQHRGQQGAGSLGRGDGVVPVDHQQPQRFAVPVGAHLGWPRAGQQLTGGAHSIDGIALARPPLTHVTAGIDLLDVLTSGSQVPGQAQPVMPGALHRPDDWRVPARGPGPGQQPRITSRGRRDLQLRHQPPAPITQRRSMRIPVSIDPHHQPGVLSNSHCPSSFDAIL
jgi:hypothetical protein